MIEPPPQPQRAHAAGARPPGERRPAAAQQVKESVKGLKA